MFALVVGFSACGGGDDETTPPGTGEGGQTPNPNPGTEVVDKFVNKAKSKNGLTIAATHNFVEVSNDAKPTTIEFAVFNKDGQDVTSNASVYVMEGSNSVKITDAKFTPEAAGTYQFWASYGTDNTKADALLSVTAVSNMPAVPVDTLPESKDFKRRVLIVQGTGVTCQYCPYAITALHNFFQNTANKDKAVLMALHTFTSGDPLWSNAAEKLRIQAGISSYPTLKLNFDNSYLASSMNIDGYYNFLNNFIPEICQKGAESAIAVSTSYNEETGVISVASKIKCDNPGNYKVSVALVQDNVFFQQSGTSNVDFWVHEAGVKDIAPATGKGFALNNGDDTEVGDVYDFCCEFNKSALYARGTGQYALDVLRDARVIVYVQANGVVVDNCVSCGLNESVGFSYND